DAHPCCPGPPPPLFSSSTASSYARFMSRASRRVGVRANAAHVPIWNKTPLPTCPLTRNYPLSATDGSKDQPVRSQNDDDSACGGREASASSLLFNPCPARRACAADAGGGRRHTRRLDHQQHRERELR